MKTCELECACSCSSHVEKQAGYQLSNTSSTLKPRGGRMVHLKKTSVIFSTQTINMKLGHGSQKEAMSN